MEFAALLRYFWQYTVKEIKNIFGRTVKAECGHLTFIKDTVECFGKKYKIKLLPVEGKIQYCHNCVRKMLIQCPRCGRTIFIGQPVTLHTMALEDISVVPGKVALDLNSGRVIGCWHCAEFPGPDWVGRWMPPGVLDENIEVFFEKKYPTKKFISVSS